MLSKILKWLIPEPELRGYQPKSDGLAKGELPPPPEGGCGCADYQFTNMPVRKTHLVPRTDEDKQC